MPFTIQWSQNGQSITGDLYFPVNYPSKTCTPITITMNSPAILLGTQEVLNNIQLFLDGPDAQTLIGWTSISNKVNLNGGLQISFDGGQTWTLFTATSGNKLAPSTWITLPAVAIGSLGSAGVLNPYDSATILLNVVVPPSITEYRVYTVNIGVDFNVI